MAKRKNPSPGLERGAHWGLSRLSETPSLLDFRHTLGNDSVLQCALHQYLNGSHWYSVFEIGCSNTFNPFLPIVLNTGYYSCVLLRGTKFEGNRSSPLYAICLNWITFLQFVSFDSKLFYGRHCQIEPDGEHPTSRDRWVFSVFRFTSW